MKKLFTVMAVLCCAAVFAAETNNSLKFNHSNFKYYGKDAYVFDDGANGKVGAMKADSGWTLSLHLPADFDFSKTYEVYALVRGTFSEANANSRGGIGVYNTVAKKIVGNVGFPIKQINTDKYQRIFVGKYKFAKGMYIYVSGVAPKNPENRIFVKEFEFIAK